MVITDLRLSNVLYILRKPQTKALKSPDLLRVLAMNTLKEKFRWQPVMADCGPAAGICAQAAQGYLIPLQVSPLAFWGSCSLKVLPSLQPQECAFSYRQELCVPSLQTLQTVPCPFASGTTDCFLEFIYNFRMTSTITSNSFRPILFQISIEYLPYNVHCA